MTDGRSALRPCRRGCTSGGWPPQRATDAKVEELRHRRNTELGVDAAAMELDRLDADEKRFRDSARLPAVEDEVEDFPLALRQRRHRGRQRAWRRIRRRLA